jgi:lipoprotein-anchoring transpeptidase ErfK/SrfK
MEMVKMHIFKIVKSIKTVKAIFFSLMLLCACSACCNPNVPYVPPEQVKDHIVTMGVQPSETIIVVDTKKQTLNLVENNKIKKSYVISTGKKGLGQRANTYKTPLGLHRIYQKIGDGVPKYGIFNKRQYVGATWKKVPPSKHTKDYISTRILRMEGLQPGFNRGRDWLGRNVDTDQRAVYIHGTTMENKLGFPSTKGCVHMSANDVIALFKEVPEGTLVWIQ